MTGSLPPHDGGEGGKSTQCAERIMKPDEVEALFKSGEQLVSNVTSENEDDEVVISEKELSRRVEKLNQVLDTVRKLLDSGSVELDAIAQKLGDGSRDGLKYVDLASWRAPLGQSGLLDFFIGLIGNDGLRQATMIQTLRIIGNSCADSDENRARVVASNCLPKIVNLLNNDSVLAYVITVLFNISVDYEPAQVALYKAGVNPELVSLISSPRLAKAEASMGIICKLLALVAGQEPEANLVHPATPFVLLTLATRPGSPSDFEDFLGQTSVALTYISNEVFQDSFLRTPNAIPLFFKAFSEACVTLSNNTSDPDDAAQLRKVQSIFTQALADISANPLFAASCSIGGPETQTLQRWISTPNTQLQSAACLALGNLARSDDVCIVLVQKSSLHKPLVAIISDPSNTDAQLLHSTLSFLKNLAIPVSNKQVLGDAGLLEPHALPRIWGLDTQIQVQFAAVSLTRLLLVSSPANVKRICALRTDASSPDNERTQLNVLMGLFSRSDQEPTKTEAARAVIAALRVLHSSPDVSSILPSTPSPPSPTSDAHSPPSSPQIIPDPAQPSTNGLRAFYADHDALSDALVYLGSQQKFPVLRSELWFVMALMSRSPDGAEAVAGCLQQTELLRALIEAVTGKELLEGQEPATAIADTTTVSSPESAPPPATASSGVADAVVGDGMDSVVGGLGLEPQQVDPAKKASMARVDRENGLVLVAELLQRRPERLRMLPVETFREILRTGGQMVLSDRDADQ